MMVNVQIRTCVDSELGAVLALWREDAAHPTTTDDLAGLQALLGRDPTALLVAEDEGRIVGTVIAGWDGWRGGIYRLAVAGSHRRRGVARALVQTAVAALEARDARRVAAVVVVTRPCGCGSAGNAHLLVGHIVPQSGVQENRGAGEYEPLYERQASA